MRILQINSHLSNGSTGKIATSIHNMLESENHDSFIAYGRGREVHQNKKFIKIGNQRDIYKHVIKTRLIDRHGFGSETSTKELIKLIDDIDPDIVHLHNIHGYYINIKVLFEYLKDKNFHVVWTLHDCWSFTGHCAHFEYIGCRKWEVGCHNCPQLDTYPKSLMIDNSKRNYNDKKEYFSNVENMYVVTPSQWLQNLISKSFLKDKSTRVISNGVNIDIFKPKPLNNHLKEKLNLKGKYIYLGVASPWTKRKGLNDLKKLSELLNSNERLLLVGLSKSQIKKLPNNVIGIERTDHIEELVDYYNLAHVFLNPTLEDTYPTTNLEAICSGTPVVTYDTGGSPESIDEHTGKIVSQGDFKALLVMVRKLRDIDLSKYEDFNLIRSRFDEKKRFKEYINLYEQVLERKKEDICLT